MIKIKKCNIKYHVFQTFVLPYIYHKKSKEEEKLENIETTVTELKDNMADTGNVTVEIQRCFINFSSLCWRI